MDAITLRQGLEIGTLHLDAIRGTDEHNIFIFAADGKEVGLALIVSQGAMKLRLFRGYVIGMKSVSPQKRERILHTIEEASSFIITRNDEKGDIIDSVQFRGKVERAADAEMYGHRMETVIINVSAIVA